MLQFFDVFPGTRMYEGTHGRTLRNPSRGRNFTPNSSRQPVRLGPRRSRILPPERSETRVSGTVWECLGTSGSENKSSQTRPGGFPGRTPPFPKPREPKSTVIYTYLQLSTVRAPLTHVPQVAVDRPILHDHASSGPIPSHPDRNPTIRLFKHSAFSIRPTKISLSNTE